MNPGSFPADANTVAQYGPRLKGLMVYLMEWQRLPSNRFCDLLETLGQVSVSEGTLYQVREQCDEALAPMETTIQQAVQQAVVIHSDERGLQVNQRLWWLHVATTDGLT